MAGLTNMDFLHPWVYYSLAIGQRNVITAIGVGVKIVEVGARLVGRLVQHESVLVQQIVL
jgi:hypothetical protein